MTIHVEVVTQERKVFDEPAADIVVIPGVEGEMGVLPRHAPLLTTMGFGELIVRKGQAEERFAIYGGVVDVRPDKVVVLADLAESSFTLDIGEIEAARERASRMLAEGVPGDFNRDTLLALRRAELGLRIHRRIQNRSGVMRILEQDEEDAD
jgi:F-type H+-transporting ATPase subunit epsilon